MKIFDSDVIKDIDRATCEAQKIDSVELMERAAEAVSLEVISRFLPRQRIVVIAGPGNNGGDALAVALMEVRHFKPRDFAQFHPGGELGRRLLTTAHDVMHTEDMPVIDSGMHLGEAIIHVSKGKLGLGVAVEDGRIAGLITDGDIRRAMERWQAEFFNHTVSDIMTREPKTVRPDTKITEIQGIMQKYKIHTVLVTDGDRHLLGIVDHYRCMV